MSESEAGQLDGGSLVSGSASLQRALEAACLRLLIELRPHPLGRLKIGEENRAEGYR